MQRIFSVLKSCPVSIHDLSAVGQPVRFNMPFELGLACALRESSGKHEFLVLEKREHRFDKHLSDLKYIDPKIHGGRPSGAISAMLDVLESSRRNPTTQEVMRLYRYLRKALPVVKRRHGKYTLFNKRVYGELVGLGYVVADRVLAGLAPE